MQHSTRVTTTSRPKRGKPILVSVLVILGVTMLVAGVFLWAFHGSGSPAGTGGSIASPEPSPTFTSKVDANGNGVDDYTDIMRGARKDAEAMRTIPAITKAGIRRPTVAPALMSSGVPSPTPGTISKPWSTPTSPPVRRLTRV